MKYFLLISLGILLCPIQSLAQEDARQVVITIGEYRDPPNKHPRFHYQGMTYQIIFLEDTVSDTFNSFSYTIDRHYGNWKSRRTKNKLKKHRYSCSVDERVIDTLVNEIDSCDYPKYHTIMSHYRLNFYIDVISGADTLHIDRNKPPIYYRHQGEVANYPFVFNQWVDQWLFKVLPKDFLAKEWLEPIEE